MAVDLDNIRVASPCNESWNDMEGDEQVRHCASCQHCVFNISKMSRDEAVSLLESRAGQRTCIRLYRRQDGTVLTQDCSVGVRRKWTTRTVIGAAAAAGIALIAGTAAAATSAIRPGSRKSTGLAAKCEATFMRQRDKLGHVFSINSWCNCSRMVMGSVCPVPAPAPPAPTPAPAPPAP